MNLNLTHIFAILSITLILSSCEKFIDFEGQDRPPRLVLNGNFKADSVFQVELSNSLGYIDVGLLVGITTGKVAVYDDQGQLVDSLTHQGAGIYKGQAVAQSGKTYTVKADSPNLPEISAIDAAPFVVPVIAWDTLSIQDPNSIFGDGQMDITFTISDPGAIENYYYAELYLASLYYINKNYDPLTGTITYDTIYYENPIESRLAFSTNDAILLSENDAAFDETRIYSSGILFTDGLFNGSTRSFTLRIDFISFITDIEVRLTSLSPSLYKYARTLQRYEATTGNPFAEPAQVYTNIEGGLGIWGGSAIHRTFIAF